MRFSCDYGMKGGASSFLGNWCYKKPGQGKSHTWRSCCSFFGDRFGGRNDNLRLSWGFHLDHIGGGLVGVMWIHGIPANSLLLSTHRPVTTLVEWGETSCVLFVKKTNLRWAMMMKSFALFTFFCFSVLACQVYLAAPTLNVLSSPGTLMSALFRFFSSQRRHWLWQTWKFMRGKLRRREKWQPSQSFSTHVLEGRRNRCNCRVPSCLHQQVWSINQCDCLYITQKAMLCLSQ